MSSNPYLNGAVAPGIIQTAAAKPVDLFANHPLTAMPAHVFDDEFAALGFFERIKVQKEIEAMKKRGAQFYWMRSENGTWARVELNNYAFAARMIGQSINLIH